MIRVSGETASEALKLTVNKSFKEIRDLEPERDKSIKRIEAKPRYAHYRKLYNIFKPIGVAS